MALSDADQLLLASVARGDAGGWAQLIARYQGRLLAFVRKRVRNDADAEDLVQETFLQFLRGIASFRGESSIETYLFLILRRRLTDRIRRPQVVCLLRDRGDEEAGDDAEANVRGDDATASTYVARDEGRQRMLLRLGEVLRDVVEGYRTQENFQDLQIAEMLFYCQLPNRRVAAMASVRENHVAVLKHRLIERLRRGLMSGDEVLLADTELDDKLLTDAWETSRPSCPKRNTIGAFLLSTLEPAWQAYTAFHVETLGCRFCQANLDDLKQQTQSQPQREVHERILQSTVGFLSKV